MDSNKHCSTIQHLLFTATLLAVLAAAPLAPSPALAAAGDLVPAFGTGGVITANPSTSTDIINAIAIDSNSSTMYVVGQDLSVGNSQWRIEKRALDTGALVSTFGSGGVVTSNPSSSSDIPYAIAIDSNANVMYVGGFNDIVGSFKFQWHIEKRTLGTGALVSSFGSGGMVMSDPAPNINAGCDLIRSIAIDPSSNAMYIVGCEATTNNRWRFEKRTLDTGALVSSFGSGGVITSNPSDILGCEEPKSIVIDTTAMYVAGCDQSTGNCQWRIEKRDLSSGALISAFGTGGIVKSNPSTATDSPADIKIDGTIMYITGYDQSPGDSQWRIEKRALDTGALVSTFGSSGVVTNNPTAWNEDTRAIAIDSNAIYLVGNDYAPGNSQWRIEKRALDTGALVSTFGSSGVVTNNPSTSLDIPYVTALDSSAIYVAGYDNSPGNYQWRIEKRESGGGAYVDCGLRVSDGISPIPIILSCEDPLVTQCGSVGNTDSLCINTQSKKYGIKLVDPADANASRVRIGAPDGAGGTVIKALRKQ